MQFLIYVTVPLVLIEINFMSLFNKISSREEFGKKKAQTENSNSQF